MITTLCESLDISITIVCGLDACGIDTENNVPTHRVHRHEEVSRSAQNRLGEQ